MVPASFMDTLKHPCLSCKCENRIIFMNIVYFVTSHGPWVPDTISWSKNWPVVMKMTASFSSFPLLIHAVYLFFVHQH